jgi:hypothetical protein
MLLVYAAMVNLRVPKYGLWNLPDQFLLLFFGGPIIVIAPLLVDHLGGELVSYLPNYELVQIHAVIPKLQELPPHAAASDSIS